MKIIRETSPYIHKKVSVERMMLDVLIALLPLCIFAIIVNGFNSLYMILLSSIIMVTAEVIFCKIIKHNISINNILSPLISGIIFALLLPTKTNVYVIIMGSLFGIIIGKLLFGGIGSNIFNPACLGRVFVMVAFGSKLNYTNDKFYDVVTGGTPLVTNDYSILDLLLGTIPGSIGEVCKILIILGGIYLFIRKSADFRVTISMLLTFLVIMFAWGITTKSENIFSFSLYQLLAGGVIFGAVFMVTDPVTSPITRPGRIWYGIIVAIIAAFIRIFGAYPEGVCFAILLGNMCVPAIDYYKWSTNKYSYKHIIAWTVVIIAAFLIVLLGA